MAITINRSDGTTTIGYGVVEDNHLSAKRSGHVYGSLPAASDITILQNGQFVCYDEAAGEVNLDNAAPWMMVYNEEKLYDERHQMHRDYAMLADDFEGAAMAPRVIAIEAGDLYTTNMLADGTYAKGDTVKIDPNTGFLSKADTATVGEFKIVKEYTMPDGQPGVKIQCLKAIQ